MATIVNPKWTDRIKGLLNNKQPVDETVGYAPAAKWLVVELSQRNIPFIVIPLQCGVKRITTNTETCPCCKRKLS